MQFNKKFIVIVFIVAVVSVSVAATAPGVPKDEFKNLQVLPKNINSKALQGIMVDEFQDALGVSCNFCHAEEKDSHHLDYASDAKPEKEIARSMMRMTMKINRENFELKDAMIGDSVLAVSCATCHHGLPHPDNTAQ
ncbi:MAG: c-type cytochrome [Ginsengibacter sp.]